MFSMPRICTFVAIFVLRRKTYSKDCIVLFPPSYLDKPSFYLGIAGLKSTMYLYNRVVTDYLESFVERLLIRVTAR